MGMPDLTRRRSTEESSSNHTRRAIFGQSETLDPTDFNDVFGGPPRTVISRQFSGEFTRTTSFYEEIFKPPDPVFAPSKSGRNLPGFKIPAGRASGGGEFYNDIFGCHDDGKMKSKSRPNSKPSSKSKSSSVLSSEELSPHRPVTGDDVAFSAFASNLRPINVSCKWNSSTMMHEEYPKKQEMPADFPFTHSSYMENPFEENEYTTNVKSYNCGFSRHVSSPETISLNPNSHGSFKVSVDDFEIMNSPSSPVSSLCEEVPEAKTKFQDTAMEQQVPEQEEDEVMSSYVIEITSRDQREGSREESDDLDEAIAWAKEKSQSKSSGNGWSTKPQQKDHQSAEMEERPEAHEASHQQKNGHGAMQSPKLKELHKWATGEEEDLSEKERACTDMEQLDEDIRLWSAGKETNIRMLLATLHHILWPDSGWYAISLTNLIKTSHVKKAYQRARLCLHPDKLQQRGAAPQQKYVADKAFSILQDAWAAFISQDVLLSSR